MRRDEEVVEAELMEISAIQDDSIKLERLIAWCTTYPDEIPFAFSLFKLHLEKYGHRFPKRQNEIGRTT